MKGLLVVLPIFIHPQTSYFLHPTSDFRPPTSAFGFL